MPVGCIPEDRGPVGAASKDLLAVRRECAGIACDREQHFSALTIPHVHNVIRTAGQDAPAVWREPNRPNTAGVTEQFAFFATRGRFPDANRVLFAAADNPLPIKRK